MFVKDLVNNSIYRGTNQKLQTVLMWRTAIVSAINFALSDIYTYEGKEWTFMYNKTELNWEETDAKTICIELPKPIKKVFILHSKIPTYVEKPIPPLPGPQYKINVIEPTEWIDDLKPDEIYFKPGDNKIYVPNNKNAGYILHWVSFYNPVDWEDEIPMPEHFMWCLYNLVMTYLYPIDWQYWDNKDANSYNKAMTQLVNLAKTDAFQINSVTWNIH